MTGRETASEEPHRNRVTGGILRISVMNDILQLEVEGMDAAFAGRDTKGYVGEVDGWRRESAIGGPAPHVNASAGRP